MPDDAEILPRPLILLLIPSLILMAIVLWSSPLQLAPVYYGTMGLIGWALLGQGRWRGVRDWLQRLPGPVWLRYAALGWGAVVPEEALVGTLFAINEGNWPGEWLPRIGQFIAFNVFAFTGMIIGLGLACARFPGLRPWHWLLAGVWGLFAERVWLIGWGNPLGGAILVAPNMVVYAIILAPAMLSLPTRTAKQAPIWGLLPVWALMLLISIPAVGLLIWLRGLYPGAFPNCEYIPCT